MLFEEEHYPDYHLAKDTEIDYMKDIAYNNSHWRDALHTAEDVFQGFNRSMFQILSDFPSLHPISLRPEYLFLAV